MVKIWCKNEKGHKCFASVKSQVKYFKMELILVRGIILKPIKRRWELIVCGVFLDQNRSVAEFVMWAQDCKSIKCLGPRTTKDKSSHWSIKLKFEDLLLKLRLILYLYNPYLSSIEPTPCNEVENYLISI